LAAAVLSNTAQTCGAPSPPTAQSTCIAREITCPSNIVMTTKTIHRGADSLALDPQSQEIAVASPENNGDRSFATLFENALDAIVVLDDAARFVAANPAACQLIGLSKDRLTGRNLADTMETNVNHVAIWNSFRREGKYCGQRWLVRGDGTRRLVEVSATTNILPGRHLVIWRDVTDRYLLEKRLAQAEKSEALARIAGGVAHDFTNLLNVIGGHTELLVHEIGRNFAVHRHTDSILAATKQAAVLTAQLSGLGRRHILSLEPLDLSALVSSFRETLRGSVGQSIDLEIELAAEPVRVRADRMQMGQVLLTLVSSANELIPEGGRLTVSVSNVSLATGYSGSCFRVPAGEYGVLTVSPHGIASDEQLPARALEPFLPVEKRGSGVALPAVYGTVRQSNGFLAVDRASDGDTIFRVYLPCIASGAIIRGRSTVEPKALTGSETILLVEDEPILRETTREYLGCLGYRVLRASNGAEALKIARSGESIDLLVTDIMMPKMSGKELASVTLSERPSIKVLFISGAVDSVLVRQQMLKSGTTIVAKPFELSVLARAIRDLLDPSLQPEAQV
jgi:two-component system cell cycle sensor histidine kinase/response regulator CckA